MPLSWRADADYYRRPCRAAAICATTDDFTRFRISRAHHAGRRMSRGIMPSFTNVPAHIDGLPHFLGAAARVTMRFGCYERVTKMPLTILIIRLAMSQMPLGRV
jgi:hypothetical protein